MKGKFIVFDGIDGCGKGTQAVLFAGRLYSAGKSRHVLLTSEPWNSEEIRRRLRQETDPYSNSELMARLYIEDRRSHIAQLIILNTTRGVHVVSDRYKFSTIGYQTTQGLDMDDLIARHSGFLIPDITFFVDVPVEIATSRLAERARRESREPKFEQPEFQEKLRRNYQKAVGLHQKKGELIYTIDGNKPIEQVQAEIWQTFAQHFSQLA